MPSFTHCSHNGEIVPLDDATISLSNIAFSYGFGVYESVRVQNGTCYFMDEHINRLFQSARIIGLEHPFDAAFIQKTINDLVSKCDTDRFNLKILLIGATKKEDTELFILPLNPLFPDKRWYKQGVKTMTYEYERPFPNAKTLSMIGSYIAYQKARENDCYDALLINQNGCITEGTRTNIFAINDRTLITPPANEILEGVTRAHVINVAKENNFTVEEVSIPFKDIQTFDGLFLTSTSSKIMPIKSVDDVELQTIPSALKELMELFDNFLKQSEGKSG